MTPSEAIRLVQKLKDGFPRIQISKGTAQIYAEFMHDLDYAEASDAIAGLIARSKFFPSIAEIREGMFASIGPGAVEVWGHVRDSAARFGRHGQPEFDTRTSAAVNAVGWERICNSTHDNQGTLCAQFRQAYESADRRITTQRNVGSLMAGPTSTPLLRGRTSALTGGGDAD